MCHRGRGGRRVVNRSLAMGVYVFVYVVFVLCLRVRCEASKPASALPQPQLHPHASNSLKDAVPTLHTSPRAHPRRALSLAPASALTAAKAPQAASSLGVIRVLFFLFYGCLGSVMPWLPTYYKSLGLSGDKIGALGAVTPAVTFIVSPLWGALADETGMHKEIMLLTFVGSVIAKVAMTARSEYWWLLSMVSLAAFLNAPVKPLMDSAVMNVLTNKAEYGKSRLFGQLGFGIASGAVGEVIDKSYMFAFLSHLVLAIPTAFVMHRFVPTKVQKEVPNIREGLKHLTSNLDVVVFFFVVFLIGLSSGVIENFAYVRLQEVGGHGRVMGVSRLVSSLAGGPMFWISGSVTNRLGVQGVLTLSLLSYILRFIIYASATSPWHGLPAELLRGVTFALFWAASTFYTHSVSPPGLTATMLGFLNGMYGGLGQSVGALIGGALQSRLGTANAFYAYAGVDTVFLVIFLLYRAWRSSQPTETESVRESDKAV